MTSITAPTNDLDTLIENHRTALAEAQLSVDNLQVLVDEADDVTEALADFGIDVADPEAGRTILALTTLIEGKAVTAELAPGQSPGEAILDVVSGVLVGASHAVATANEE